jgi:hypothetical protein
MKSNRRQFFQTAGAGAAGLGMAPAITLATSCSAPKSSNVFTPGYRDGRKSIQRPEHI